MPNEPIKGEDPSKNGDGNPDPKKTDVKNDPEPQDPSAGSKKSDNFEDWSEEQKQEALKYAYKSDRFKQLLDSDKELKKLRETQEKEEEEKMKEEGKLKELVEKKDGEIQALKDQIQNNRLQNAIILESQKAGIQDTEAAIKLIDSDAIKYDDNGNPTNVAEVVSTLAESKPYLVGNGGNTPPSNIGARSNPKPPTGGKATYKLSELRRNMKDHKWYKENQQEVKAAFKEGRVINDESN